MFLYLFFPTSLILRIFPNGLFGDHMLAPQLVLAEGQTIPIVNISKTWSNQLIFLIFIVTFHNLISMFKHFVHFITIFIKDFDIKTKYVDIVCSPQLKVSLDVILRPNNLLHLSQVCQHKLATYQYAQIFFSHISIDKLAQWVPGTRAMHAPGSNTNVAAIE